MKRRIYNKPKIELVYIDKEFSLVLMSGLPDPNDPWGAAQEPQSFNEEGIFPSKLNDSPSYQEPDYLDRRDVFGGDSPF